MTKTKLVRVELYFMCREDCDTKTLTSIVSEKGHELADRARSHCMRLPSEDDILFCGTSFMEKDTALVMSDGKL